MRTADGLNGYCRKTKRTFFCRRRRGRRLFFFLQSVDIPDDKKYGKGDYQKTHDSIEKYSVVQCYAPKKKKKN